MKRRCTFSILLSVLLLGSGVPCVLADTGASTARQDHVDVYNCVATPNTVEVPKGGYLHWDIPDTTQDASEYFVIFDPSNNPLPSTVPQFSLKRSDPPHLFSAPACTIFRPNACKFSYKLRQHTTSSLSDCPDPNVRVVPPMLIIFLLSSPLYGAAILALIAILSYVGFRMFSRN
jgi:hypothetical protein